MSDLAYEGQKDADGSASRSRGIQQAQDKPLLQVGTYDRPMGSISDPVTMPGAQNVKCAYGENSQTKPGRPIFPS